MAEPTKPSERPKWAATGTIITPSNSKQDSGWTGAPEKPPYQYFNWFQLRVYQWLLWAEGKIDAALGSQAPTTLVLSADKFTPTQGSHLIDTEGAAATDNLSNIFTTNLDDGRLLIIRSVSSARVITVKHNFGGAGQISLAHALDVVLDDPRKYLTLIRNGTDWKELSRSVTPFDERVTVSSTATAPLVNGYDLGSTTKRFNAYFTGLDSSGTASFATFSISGAATLGSTTGGTLTHLLQSGAATIVRIMSVGAAANADLEFYTDSTSRAKIRYDQGNARLAITNAAGTQAFYVDTATGGGQFVSTLGVTGATTLSSTLGVTGISTFGDTIRAANGTASSLSYSFTNSTGTGIYRAAADSMRFISASATVAEFDFASTADVQSRIAFTTNVGTTPITRGYLGIARNANDSINGSTTGDLIYRASNGHIWGSNSTSIMTLSAAGVLTVSSNAIVGGTFAVSGNSTLASLGVTGNATVGGTFNVTGVSSFGTTSGVASAQKIYGLSGDPSATTPGVILQTYAVQIGSDANPRALLSNTTTKAGYMLLPHYNTSFLPHMLIGGVSNNSINSVVIGGGTGSYNAATAINFYTATSTNSVTGIDRGGVDSAGTWTLGTASGGAGTHVIRSDAAGGTLDLKGSTSSIRTGLSLTQNTSTNAYFSLAASSGDLITGAVAGDLAIRVTNNLLFGNNGTNAGSLSSAGKWTLGAASGTQAHAINGDVDTTLGIATGGNGSGHRIKWKVVTGSVGGGSSVVIAHGLSGVTTVLSITGVYSAISGSASAWGVIGGSGTTASALNFQLGNSIDATNVILNNSTGNTQFCRIIIQYV